MDLLFPKERYILFFLHLTQGQGMRLHHESTKGLIQRDAEYLQLALGFKGKLQLKWLDKIQVSMTNRSTIQLPCSGW